MAQPDPPLEPHRLFIGMPVYNGASGVGRAITHLLEQSFQDFTLVVSDNGSTDDTPQIAESFTQRDPRVHLIREETNRGPTWNFNRLLDKAAGHEFFMWAAHDDHHAPEFLSRCIEQLARRPSVAVCGVRSQFVDASGRLTGATDWGVTTTSARPIDRALQYVHEAGPNSIFYGVLRTERIGALRIMNRLGGDQAFLMALSLTSELVTLPDVLMTRRLGGASRSPRAMYNVLGVTPMLWARVYHLDMYQAFLDVADTAEALTPEERRLLRRELIKLGIRKHVLGAVARRLGFGRPPPGRNYLI